MVCCFRNEPLYSLGILLAALVVCRPVLSSPSGSITTTVYIGRHFEVREHDQPTKYVFNGSTRVAEITGSLSSSLRVQRLHLFPGWNLCSLAVNGPFPASGAEVISAAYQWNTGTGDYSIVTLGQTLAAGTILWLKAETNAAVSVLGTYTDPAPQQVKAGGTYVSGAGLEAWSPALPDSASSWEFYARVAQWSNHLVGGLAAFSDPPPVLSPGKAFYLQVAASVSLDNPDPTLRIRYYHQDHLGSSSVITDSTGQIVDESAYYPFGSARNAFGPRQVPEPYQFTQKERDRESGLYYFEARHLAAPLTRFLSADPKFANPDLLAKADLAGFSANPQEINLYCYARNNPLRYIDPTGLDTRPLTKEETEEAQKVFGNSIRWDEVRLEDSLGWGGVEYTMGHTIHVGEAGFKANMASDGHNNTLIHELVHVWQSEHNLTSWGYAVKSGASHIFSEYVFSGINWEEASKGHIVFEDAWDPYSYDRGDLGKKSWSSFGVEQQAQIIEDWYKNGSKETDPVFGYVRDSLGRTDATIWARSHRISQRCDDHGCVYVLDKIP